MRRTILILVVVAALAAALAVGIFVSRAQGSSDLPAITPTQLLTDMATKGPQTTSLSGDFSWSNNLLGSTPLSLGSITGSGSASPSSITSLLGGGSGRLWLQAGTPGDKTGGKARLEAQGAMGDLIIVVNPPTVWTYSSTTNTATEYTLPSLPGTGSATPSPLASPTVNPSQAITKLIEKLAPTATLQVTGQEVVAGQQAYILTLTPTSTNTTLGSVQVAVDGQKFVPLRVQVFAKGSDKAQLSAGFTSVSYSPIADSMFTFTPPAGSKVEHKTLSLPADVTGLLGKLPAVPNKAGSESSLAPFKHTAKPLNLRQAKAKARRLGMTLMAAPSSTSAGLPFTGAEVVRGHKGQGPLAVLHYGKGFGSVVLFETRLKATELASLQKSLGTLRGGAGGAASPLRLTMVHGAPGYQLDTSLFSLVAWQHGKVTVVAAGMVPSAELATFVSGVR